MQLPRRSSAIRERAFKLRAQPGLLAGTRPDLNDGVSVFAQLLSLGRQQYIIVLAHAQDHAHGLFQLANAHTDEWRVTITRR